MNPVLYRRWRSQSFSELVGQEHVTRTLLNALATGRLAHAYLFCGPRGTGKTSAARILAKAINCLDNDGRGEPCNRCSMCQSVTQGRSLDLIEIDAASNRGIDEIRDLREKVNFVPNQARYKVYIIDEVHMLTHGAFNALLKTLEEPPGHIVFILATTEAHQVPSTIISRCQRFDFRRIPAPEMVQRLSHICREEGISAQPEALELLARRATGSLRDAENMLDQLVADQGAEIDLAQVQELLGLTSDQRVQELARLILEKDIPGGLASINAISEEGVDLRQFARQLVERLRQLLLCKMNGPLADLTPEAREEMASLVRGIQAQELVRAVKLFAQADVRLEVPSTLPLELALAEYSLPQEEAQETTTVTHRRAAQRSTVLDHPQEEAPETASVPPTMAPQERPAAPRPILAPRPQAAVPAPPLPASDDPLEYLNASWPRVLAEVRSINKNVEALLRGSCRVLAVDDGSVTLGFFWELHKAKLEEAKTRRLVEEILSRALGRSCQIKCVLTPKESRGASTPQPPAPAPDDPLVDMAVREYGARVVSQSVRPTGGPADLPEET